MMILRKIINKNFLLLFLIFLILILIPQLFWGKLFIVGGDDSRLYYIFPEDFLKNFVFKISSDNILGNIAGYSPRSFLAPIIFIIFLLKQISFLNVQLLMYGLNLAFGFLFFYLFLGLFIKKNQPYNVEIKIISSLFYIFSTYLIQTLYTNQLLAVYLVSTVPCTLYLFIKGVREKNIALVLLSVLIYSIFSSTFNTLPWSMALLIVLVPLLFFVFLEHKKTFLFYSVIFFVFLILTNLHWIAQLVYSQFSDTGSASVFSYYSANPFRYQSGNLIKAVIGIFTPLNWVFNERSTNFLSTYTVFIAIKSIFLLFIILAGIVADNKDKKLFKYYLISLYCLALSFFFFSPSFGNWSINLFVFLNNNVPFFSMFRNMYDKFSFALSFSYAFAFAIAAIILLEKLKNKKIAIYFLSFILIIILINTRSFISPTYKDSNFSTRISGDFSKDFYSLNSYLKNIDDSFAVMWLPLNYPGYVYIEDVNNKNHFYFGTSPVSILAGRKDYAGYLSFGTAFDPDLGRKIFKLIKEKRYSEVGRILRLLNIKYIVDNKTSLPKEAENFLYSETTPKIEDTSLRNALLGVKVKDFGKDFSLYKINDAFRSTIIYLSDNSLNVYMHNGIKFSRKSSSEYSIVINNFSGRKTLVFQDLYNKGWKLNIKGKKQSSKFKKENFSLYNNFANGWILDENEIQKSFNKEFYTKNPDGSINFTLDLYFFPQRINNIGIAVSAISFFAIIIYELRYLYIKMRKIK